MFLQSYAADKRLTVRDLRPERVDVVVGAALTGIIGAFVVIACAATLHPPAARSARRGTPRSRSSRSPAASPPPCSAPVSLGAGLLAASILPLSTAYAVCDAVGVEAALDDRVADARLFYGTYGAVVVIAVGIVLIPGAPLIDILFLTQALNAVLLLPLLWFMRGVASDRRIMGEHALGTAGRRVTLAVLALVGACIALFVAAPARLSAAIRRRTPAACPAGRAESPPRARHGPACRRSTRRRDPRAPGCSRAPRSPGDRPRGR